MAWANEEGERNYGNDREKQQTKSISRGSQVHKEQVSYML
jgi:hypothetical protein